MRKHPDIPFDDGNRSDIAIRESNAARLLTMEAQRTLAREMIQTARKMCRLAQAMRNPRLRLTVS